MSKYQRAKVTYYIGIVRWPGVYTLYFRALACRVYLTQTHGDSIRLLLQTA